MFLYFNMFEQQYLRNDSEKCSNTGKQSNIKAKYYQ